ncbi:MAG: hypothetical protein ACJA07_003671 [Rhodococcus sp. (in: high G+C Gram-positive bacteria)]
MRTQPVLDHRHIRLLIVRSAGSVSARAPSTSCRCPRVHMKLQAVRESGLRSRRLSRQPFRETEVENYGTNTPRPNDIPAGDPGFRIAIEVYHPLSDLTPQRRTDLLRSVDVQSALVEKSAFGNARVVCHTAHCGWQEAGRLALRTERVVRRQWPTVGIEICARMYGATNRSSITSPTVSASYPTGAIGAIHDAIRQ